VVGAGGNPPQSAQNGNWKTISLSGNPALGYNGYITDGDWGSTVYGTGGTNLTLPFVAGTTGNNNGPQPYEIIRRPPAGENATSPLGGSRLYNEAEIRILLSDSPAQLPGGVGDPQNVRLANGQFNGGPNYSNGVQTSVIAGMPALAAGHSYTTYFATATSAIPDSAAYVSTVNYVAPDWLYQPQPPMAGYTTLFDLNAPVMQQAGDGSALTRAPSNVALAVCNPKTPVNVPPGTIPNCTASYPYYTQPTYPVTPANDANVAVWNLLDGYLRVEYRNAAGNFIPVTQEWLSLGFARGLTPPTAPQTNQVNPNAILLFQEPAHRNGTGALDANGTPPGTTISSCGGSCKTYTPYPGKPPEVTKDPATGDWRYADNVIGASPSEFNWYPINFYDAREGEPRDTQYATNSCTANGVMNAIEIDVGNLAKWLNGTIAGSGTNVDFASQNGYILYFSDRRGMLPNPNGDNRLPVPIPPNTITGDSGLEDSVNRASAAGTPDGALDPFPPGKNFSDEDVNLNGRLDSYGTNNLGLGMGYIPAPAANNNAPPTPGTAGGYNANNNVDRQINATAPADNPYIRMPNCSIAQANWVSGARHVLKLVDGGLGNVPVRLDNAQGGFTVGSENPVYVVGNYNTNAGDPIWQTPAGADVAHSAAGIVADATTMLSNNWNDWQSILTNATDPATNRLGATTYYRVAIASGKNINFPFPAWENNTDYGFGTDGGVHNFLRFLEDWQDPGATLNYEGSLVSLYYATYNTGTFKCCTYAVYQPPTRNYIFDPDFTTPQNLPPGTPLFRDIDNLSYRQNFTPHTGSY
jgi:hypothetical protein